LETVQLSREDNARIVLEHLRFLGSFLGALRHAGANDEYHLEMDGPPWHYGPLFWPKRAAVPVRLARRVPLRSADRELWDHGARGVQATRAKRSAPPDAAPTLDDIAACTWDKLNLPTATAGGFRKTSRDVVRGRFPPRP
jgi:hypothetical protein